MSDSLRPHGLQHVRFPCLHHFPKLSGRAPKPIICVLISAPQKRDTQIKRRRASEEGGIGWTCVATSQLIRALGNTCTFVYEAQWTRYSNGLASNGEHLYSFISSAHACTALAATIRLHLQNTFLETALLWTSRCQ